MKVIAVYSMKGGVGKTAAAANLAALASLEEKTLLWDLDPQGSATYYFRVKPKKKLSFRKLLKGYSVLDRYIRETDYPNLHLLPARMSHRKMDFVLKNKAKPKKQLLSVLAGFPRDYGFVFLDCPPNITLLSENVFGAADIILVPVIPTTLAVLSFEKVVKFFRQNNLDLKRLIPYFSMVEGRKTMHRESMSRMEGHEVPFLKTSIPYSADVEKMGFHRSPIHFFKPGCFAAQSYAALWKELKRRTSRR